MSDTATASPIPLLRLAFPEEDIAWIAEEIKAVLRSGFLTLGERVRLFEEQFAAFCGVKWAVATNGGTGALEMALRAVDVAGGVVVMPSNTYMATALAAIHAGAKVRFTECCWADLQMDPDDLARCIDADTKAVVLVHIGGMITERWERIRDLCLATGVPLIEDAAHAHGAVYKNRRAGTFGVAAAFSFYPTKVLTTGEGGMLTTNDREIYERAVRLREHGKLQPEVNIHTELGSNWCLSEVQAVLGLQQMTRANGLLAERRRLAALYDHLLSDSPNVSVVRPGCQVQSSYYKYIAYLPGDVSRELVKRRMLEDGIALTGEVYAHPCHSQPLFVRYPQYLASRSNSCFSVTDEVSKRHICLPLYPGLGDDEVERVVVTLNKHLHEFVG